MLLMVLFVFLMLLMVLFVDLQINMIHCHVSHSQRFILLSMSFVLQQYWSVPCFCFYFEFHDVSFFSSFFYPYIFSLHLSFFFFFFFTDEYFVYLLYFFRTHC